MPTDINYIKSLKKLNKSQKKLNNIFSFVNMLRYLPIKK
jgi:hypothetical protein